jgi:hypothetical protein
LGAFGLKELVLPVLEGLKFPFSMANTEPSLIAAKSVAISSGELNLFSTEWHQ